MPTRKIHQGDVLTVLRGMRANTYHGALTDPPYGYSFMNAKWDKGVPDAEVWAQVLRVLKPGAFLLAFGGTRTYHRLTCAIEDAGFEIRDCIMWLYGSGFPKAKSCLKPAYEPIILARKRGPMVPLAIDKCRIGTAVNTVRPVGKSRIGTFQLAAKTSGRNDSGGWPANVILDELSAEELDRQSGITVSNRHSRGAINIGQFGGIAGETGNRHGLSTRRGHSDSGGASRFFYCAKASRAERNAGLERLPTKFSATMGKGIGKREHDPDEPRAYQ